MFTKAGCSQMNRRRIQVLAEARGTRPARTSWNCRHLGRKRSGGRDQCLAALDAGGPVGDQLDVSELAVAGPDRAGTLQDTADATLTVWRGFGG